jgi:hypothetical protein
VSAIRGREHAQVSLGNSTMSCRRSDAVEIRDLKRRDDTIRILADEQRIDHPDRAAVHQIQDGGSDPLICCPETDGEDRHVR